MDVLEMEIQQIQEERDAIEQSSLSAEEKGGALQNAKDKVVLLSERNRQFPARISSANSFYHIYATTTQTAYHYMHEADHVYSEYVRLFTNYRFSNEYPAHILVYPDHATYLKYEKVNPAVAGHAMSDRLTFKKYVETSKGLEVEEELRPGTKLQRLAFYVPAADDLNQTTFAHELAHLFNWDMVNQDAPAGDEITPNLFLNEGLAEYFGVMDDRKQHELRIAALRRITKPVGPWEWLGLPTYPPYLKIREFYAEAYLFSRWLTDQKPVAGERLKAFLAIHSLEEAEETMQQLTQRFVPRIDLNAYAAYRQKILE